VPYRVVRPRSPSPRRRSTHRVSRTEVIRESRPQSSTYVVPAPQRYPHVPAPQPVPVFVQPPPPPPSSHHGGGAHYVEVSPRSSVTSATQSDYVIHEREVRRERRDYSPARSSAYGDRSPTYETYRYIDPPEPHYLPRERSRSRDRRSFADGSYRETRERVLIVDDDGRRRREYRR